MLSTKGGIGPGSDGPTDHACGPDLCQSHQVIRSGRPSSHPTPDGRDTPGVKHKQDRSSQASCVNREPICLEKHLSWHLWPYGTHYNQLMKKINNLSLTYGKSAQFGDTNQELRVTLKDYLQKILPVS